MATDSLSDSSKTYCQICYEDLPSGERLARPEDASADLTSEAKTDDQNHSTWHGCLAKNKFCGSCVTQYLKVSLM